MMGEVKVDAADILLKLRNEDELYNKFDPLQGRLSSDVYGYIKTCFEEIPLKERRNAVLHVRSDKRIDTKLVEHLLTAEVYRELAGMDKALHINRAKMIRLYVIGIALIVLGIALALTLDQVILEVISIVGSMAVKDAATIQIEYNPDIKLKKRLLEQLKTVKIVDDKL